MKAIERYIIYPGQATAYMVGRLKISELGGKLKLVAEFPERNPVVIKNLSDIALDERHAG